MHAIVSIHDVMPATLDRVQVIAGMLPEAVRRHLVLLVVPGLPWTDRQLAILHDFEGGGAILAGHGWRHRAERISGLGHRLHSRWISRNAAEHLSLTRAEIVDLLERCYQWFPEHGFSPPDLYVPPAWAMGAVGMEQLAAAPFRYYEDTAGLIDSRERRRKVLPLVGFEADTVPRKAALRLFNGCNRWLASPGRPLRISIHPDDDRLMLAAALRRLLEDVEAAVCYRDVFR